MAKHFKCSSKLLQKDTLSTCKSTFLNPKQKYVSTWDSECPNMLWESSCYATVMLKAQHSSSGLHNVMVFAPIKGNLRHIGVLDALLHS